MSLNKFHEQKKELQKICIKEGLDFNFLDKLIDAEKSVVRMKRRGNIHQVIQTEFEKIRK